MNLAVRQSFVPVKGTDIHWAEIGEGRPLVLLHGLGDSHRTWLRIAPVLGRSRRVLMPDLAGHGLSSRPDASYSLDWHAKLMGAWLTALKLDEVDIVGHSYGGGVAQWMLLDHRASVRRLALIAPGGLGREVGLGLRLCAIPNMVEQLGQPLMSPGTRIAMRFANDIFDREDADVLGWMNARPGTARAFGRTVRDVIDLGGQRRHFLEHAHQVGELPPIAVYWGDRDSVIPLKHALEIADVMDAVEFTRFRDCGHFPHREKVSEVAARLEGFFDAATREPTRVRPAMLTPARRPSFLSRVAGIGSGISAAVRARPVAA